MMASNEPEPIYNLYRYRRIRITNSTSTRREKKTITHLITISEIKNVKITIFFNPPSSSPLCVCMCVCVTLCIYRDLNSRLKISYFNMPTHSYCIYTNIWLCLTPIAFFWYNIYICWARVCLNNATRITRT